jgi:hypothetical protein
LLTVYVMAELIFQRRRNDAFVVHKGTIVWNSSFNGRTIRAVVMDLYSATKKDGKIL